MIEKYANPNRFQTLSKHLIPLFGILSLIAFTVGLYIAFFASPPDYQQKETVRIMYIHVPAAWMSMSIFFWMGISSFLVIWRRHHLANIAAKSMAPIGAVLAFICLVTGALWGKPTWGTYWIWDARLTSMLLLFFLYIGYILIQYTTEDHFKASKISAIFASVGLINLPIIKFSVEWWNTLHQGPSIIRAGGPSIHETMLWPLFTMAFAYLCLTVFLTLINMRTELLQQKIEGMLRRKVSEATHA
ncbi:MAG: heme ABC transporter permease [Pseudomonadota bacterium]